MTEEFTISFFEDRRNNSGGRYVKTTSPYDVRHMPVKNGRLPLINLLSTEVSPTVSLSKKQGQDAELIEIEITGRRPCRSNGPFDFWRRAIVRSTGAPYELSLLGMLIADTLDAGQNS